MKNIWNNLKNKVGVGALICMTAAGLAACGNKGSEAVVHISQEEAKKIMDKKEEDYIILDVRRVDEFNDGHIPEAICIPNETIDENVVKKLPDKDQLLLVYCRSGNRSRQAAAKLERLGYTNIKEFGGIITWPYEIV